MAFVRLDMLPIETLLAIGDTLESLHQPSVASFSLVSRQCRRAAASVLFRTVNVLVEGPEQLASEVDRWTSILLENDIFRHVRDIRISGDIDTDWHADASLSASFDSEMSWTPVARLIEKMPGLRHLHFCCDDYLPACLLGVLAKDTLSSCRIHWTGFRLPSLNQSPSSDLIKPLELNMNDHAHIISPNMYALTLFTGNSMSKTPNFTPEAIYEIVARACPGLKEVAVVHQRIKASPRAPSKKAFPGLKLNQNLHRAIRPPNAKAELTSLTLQGRQPQLQEWGKCTNFDTLRVLKITGITDVAVLEWAADFARFPSLSCLEVQNPDGDDFCVIRFLDSLPPLENLTILGAVEEPMVHAVVKNHAASLRSLSLPKLFCSAGLVFTLREQCSYLEHLETTISRTEGDSNEIAIYTALGSHPRLRTLRLDLDCSVDIGNDPLCAEPAFDVVHRDVNYHQSHVQRTLLNCALDSVLAASIFNAIACAKPALSTPLLRVELNVIKAGVIVSGGRHCIRQSTAKVFRHFTRTWVCAMDPRDDREGEVRAVESETSRLVRQQFEEIGEQPPRLGSVDAAFRTVWPEATSEDWREDWKSLELARE